MTVIGRVLLATIMVFTTVVANSAAVKATVGAAVSTGVTASAPAVTRPAPAQTTARVPAVAPTVTFAGRSIQAPAAANITPRNTGLPDAGGDGDEEEPPEPQYRWEYSGNLTGWEPLNSGRMSYSRNQVPYVDSSSGNIPSAWWFIEQRGVSGRGPGACADNGNPFYWSDDGNANYTCSGSGADAVTRCLFDYRGSDPLSPYTQWSTGISYSTSAIWRIDREMVSLDGGETWSPTGKTQRGAITLQRKTDWGGCDFYSSGPVSDTITCLTKIGPVTYEGPLQSKGLPAKDFRAGRWVTIPETEYKPPRTIKNAGGGTWTFTTPIGQQFAQTGKRLQGYGQINGSLSLVDGCQDIEMPLPRNIEIEGWGNYKFAKNIEYVDCEIVTDSGFGTRNFRGCESKAPKNDITWAYKLCGEKLVWANREGDPLKGPNTVINFDPTLCDPNPDCLWSNPRTGQTEGGRGIPDRYVTSESGKQTLVLAGSGTDADSSVMVAADGRPVRIDTPELTMSIPGGRGSSTYCPEGTQRINASTCRVFADYTYSTTWEIVRYNPRWVDTSYYVDTSRWERVNIGNEPIWENRWVPQGGCTVYWWSNGACLCPAGMGNSGGQCWGPMPQLVGWRPIYQNVWVSSGYWVRQGYTAYDPVYGWVTRRDPAPAGYSDNGTRWFKDVESIDNTSNTRYTVWEVRRGSTPWAPGGVAVNGNPNAGDQPFGTRAGGQAGVLSMAGSGVEKFGTSTDGYKFDVEQLAKDPTKGAASRPLSVNGGSQWALDLELNFYEPAAEYSDVLNENRFVVRGHFQQLWNEEFELSSVSRFKTMYTPRGSVPYIGIVEGPTRVQRFEITETCSTAEQNFTVVGTRNSPN